MESLLSVDFPTSKYLAALVTHSRCKMSTTSSETDSIELNARDEEDRVWIDLDEENDWKARESVLQLQNIDRSEQPKGWCY